MTEGKHEQVRKVNTAVLSGWSGVETAWRYQRDSFWAGCGLYEYVQIFVISNGTNTKYYSNTTRANHIKEAETGGRNKSKKTSNSFEFSSFWADSNNKVINDLVDFTKTFFSKHTLLNILTKYCVFTSERMLMVMRPTRLPPRNGYSRKSMLQTTTNFTEKPTEADISGTRQVPERH